MNGKGLEINAKVGGGALGGHVGILLVWFLKSYLGLTLGDAEIGSIIAICTFGAAYLIKVPNGTAVAAMLAFLLVLPGCAQFFTAKTVVTYEADGRKITYESDKEQTGLDVKYVTDDQGKVKEIRIQVDKAGTQESVVRAAMEQQAQFGRVVESILPLIKAAATKTPPVP